jgi:hypothetical protein
LQGLARSLHFFIGVFMRKASLALSCFLLAGTVLAQQAPSKTPSSTPAAAPSDSKALAASPAPANPLTDAQAKDMLEMTGASAMKEQLQHTMMNYFKTNMPFLPQDVSTDLEESFQKLDFDTPIIAIYKQHISTEDARGQRYDEGHARASTTIAAGRHAVGPQDSAGSHSAPSPRN